MNATTGRAILASESPESFAKKAMREPECLAEIWDAARAPDVPQGIRDARRADLLARKDFYWVCEDLIHAAQDEWGDDLLPFETLSLSALDLEIRACVALIRWARNEGPEAAVIEGFAACSAFYAKVFEALSEPRKAYADSSARLLEARTTLTTRAASLAGIEL